MCGWSALAHAEFHGKVCRGEIDFRSAPSGGHLSGSFHAMLFLLSWFHMARMTFRHMWFVQTVLAQWKYVGWLLSWSFGLLSHSCTVLTSEISLQGLVAVLMVLLIVALRRGAKRGRAGLKLWLEYGGYRTEMYVCISETIFLLKLHRLMQM